MESYSHEKDVFKTPHIEHVLDTGKRELPRPETQKKNYVPAEHFEIEPDFFDEPQKEKIPEVFLMDEKARALYIADKEYSLNKIKDKIRVIAEQSVAKERTPDTEKHFFQKNHPEILRMVRESDILEGQKKFYERLLHKIHSCAALYTTHTLDQIHIFSQNGKIMIEDVTLVEREQKKRLELDVIRKEQEKNRELISLKQKGYFQSENAYKRELASLDEKNKVLQEREIHIKELIHGENGILTKRIAIESITAEVLQQLTALGERVPERFSQETIPLEQILKHTEQLLRLYIGHTKLSREEEEMVAEYKRMEKPERETKVSDVVEQDQIAA